MEFTKKRYKFTNGKYLENPNGYIPGFEWTDIKGVKRRALFMSSVDDLENERTSATCRYERFEEDPRVNDWVLVLMDTSYATMESYVNNQGVLQTDPYEDDLASPIYDEDLVTIIGYNKKLKNGMIPEFAFVFAFQNQLFDGIMMSIMVRKFGATSFN